MGKSLAIVGEQRQPVVKGGCGDDDIAEV